MAWHTIVYDEVLLRDAREERRAAEARLAEERQASTDNEVIMLCL